jgi:hypothetical protein
LVCLALTDGVFFGVNDFNCGEVDDSPERAGDNPFDTSASSIVNRWPRYHEPSARVDLFVRVRESGLVADGDDRLAVDAR